MNRNALVTFPSEICFGPGLERPVRFIYDSSDHLILELFSILLETPFPWVQTTKRYVLLGRLRWHCMINPLGFKFVIYSTTDLLSRCPMFSGTVASLYWPS